MLLVLFANFIGQAQIDSFLKSISANAIIIIITLSIGVALHIMNRRNNQAGSFISSIIGSAIIVFFIRILWNIGSNPTTITEFLKASSVAAFGQFLSGIGGIAVFFATIELVKVTSRLNTATAMQTYATTAPQVQIYTYLEHDPKTQEEDQRIKLVSTSYAYQASDEKDREFVAWAAKQKNAESTPCYLVICFANMQQKGYYALVSDAKMTVTITFPKTSTVDSNFVGAVGDPLASHSISRTLEARLLGADGAIPIKAFRIDPLPSFGFVVSQVGYKNHKNDDCGLAIGTKSGFYTKEQGLNITFGKFDPIANEVPS